MHSKKFQNQRRESYVRVLSQVFIGRIGAIVASEIMRPRHVV